MATILDNIELEMAQLIAGMTTIEGFNFNWSIVNEEEEIIGDFPRAIIDPRDVLADKETSRDTLAGIGSNDYTNEVLFTILVSGELPAFDSNPNFAIRSIMRQANDDLKQLFGIYNQLNGLCDNILYVASQIEPIKRNDMLQTAQLRSMWKVVYSQDRISPTQYAGS
jgi:hypothetical protein